MPIDDRKCILLFIKAPVAGTVKTRLADRFGQGTIRCLYKGFVTDFLATLATTGHDIRIFYDPPDKRDMIVKWLGNGFPLYPQSSGDLGIRMKNAFSETFAAGYTDAVLVGSDIPDLPDVILKEAVQALGRFPAVIGPSADGGYYLIGFSAEGFVEEAFDRIPWSTDRVFASTLKRFATCSRSVHVLAHWWDIDTYDDLVNLAQRLRHQPDRLPNTRRTLAHLGFL